MAHLNIALIEHSACPLRRAMAFHRSFRALASLRPGERVSSTASVASLVGNQAIPLDGQTRFDDTIDDATSWCATLPCRGSGADGLARRIARQARRLFEVRGRWPGRRDLLGRNCVGAAAQGGRRQRPRLTPACGAAGARRTPWRRARPAVMSKRVAANAGLSLLTPLLPPNSAPHLRRGRPIADDPAPVAP